VNAKKDESDEVAFSESVWDELWVYRGQGLAGKTSFMPASQTPQTHAAPAPALDSNLAGLLHQLELTGRAAGAPLVPTTAAKLGNVARAASRFYNTRVRMRADYVAARCAELLAVCGESLEPPPTVPPTPVPPGGVSQRRQMQRLRQALLGQEPAKVRLVAWVDREIRLWHVLRRLTGQAGENYTTDHAIAQLKRMKDDPLKRMKDDPLETENQ
jgi:hypothetical protein